MFRTAPFTVLLINILTMLFASACNPNTRYPIEVREDSFGRVSTITLRTDELTVGSGEKVTIKTAQTTVEDRTKRRHLFIVLPNEEQRYIGEMAPQAEDSSLEFLFFEIDGVRLIAVWVDEDIAKEPLALWVNRPEQLESDEPMQLRIRSDVINQVALIPIHPDSAALWDQLTGVDLLRRQEVDGVQEWRRQYEPPLSIESNYIEVPLQ